MFKLLTLCLIATIALTNASPSVVSPWAYPAPVLAASHYSHGFASPYFASYVSPYAAAVPYAATHYGAHYGGHHHPYGSIFLRR